MSGTAGSVVDIARTSLSKGRAHVQRVLDRVTTKNWEGDADLPQQHGLSPKEKGYKRSVIILAFQAVGIVYGDIGTSPLYTFASVFTSVDTTEANVLGALSLILYTFTMIVVVKYALLVLYADDNKQGGTFALYSLLQRYFEGTKDSQDSHAVAAADFQLTKYSIVHGRQSMRWRRSATRTSLDGTSTARPHFQRPTRTSLDGNSTARPGPRPYRSMYQLGLSKAASSAGDALVNDHPSMQGISKGAHPTVGSLDSPMPSIAPAAPPAQDKEKPVLEGWRDQFGAQRWLQLIVRYMVVIGVGAIMGDGVLTPAISVVSAVEGLQVAIPSITRGVIVGVSIAIIASLFLVQRYGTGKIGVAFSPIVCLWFIFNSMIGIYNVCKWNPGVFRAFAPNYWFAYFLRNRNPGWRSLGGILLCITGSEALFADMGHFSRPAIQLSTLVLVYPSLMLTYLGQAAYLTKHPEDVSLAYFRALPGFTYWPMIIIATLAAIVASQALISAVFSIVFQAIGQGFFPRFHVVHTSKKIFGQVYIPFINYLLMLLTLIVVGTFRTSEHIGRAYGLAVIVDMLFTTHFLTLVMLFVWRSNALGILAFYVIYAAIEGTFLSASVEKIPTGGWFSIMMAAIYASIMLLWFWGSNHKRQFFKKRVVEVEQLLTLHPDSASPDASLEDREAQLCLVSGGARVVRVPGVALVFSEHIYGVPPVLAQQITKFPAVHEVVVFLTNRFVPVPDVLDHELLLIEQLGVSGFYHCIARYGYSQKVDQGPKFIIFVLDNVLKLLYSTLQQALVDTPTLLHRLAINDLGGVLASICAAPSSNNLAANGATGLPPNLEQKSVSLIASASAADPDAARLSPRIPSATPSINPAEAGSTAAAADAPDTVNIMVDVPDEKGSATSVRHPSLRPAGFNRVSNGPQVAVNITSAVRTFLDEVVVKLDQCESLPPAFRRIQLLAKEILVVKHAKTTATEQVVYMMGRSHPRLRSDSNPLRRYLLEFPYQLLVNNLQMDASRVFGIPDERISEHGMVYTV
ncbi:hypothetical protein WJX72_002866 [[Myrmecia] bisecta]|uniref:Potassium transporter n=1 Tax=[Myrmecia] bisecta TaxID=41462 RepID=A0AAW1P3W6_9CHLO